MVGADGLDRDEFIRGVKDRVALRAPGKTVDWLVSLDKVRSEISVFGPDFQSPILPTRGKSSSIVAPFHTDDGPFVGIRDVLIQFAVLTKKFETSVGIANGQQF